MKNNKKIGLACLLTMLGLLSNHTYAQLENQHSINYQPIDLPENLAQRTDYTLFEVGQVRPLAVSHDGRYLFAANTPDDRLEVFTITDSGIEHSRSISVGLRPVALAEDPQGRVWVVNHLSDSVSVVNVSTGQVEQTLWVGDEPRDIVFAGENQQRAFITTAHRGQNSPIDPQLTTPGIGRADVWVFDSGALSATQDPAPVTIVTLFADTPRALAKSPDGNKVYVAAFHSGNQTTALHEFITPNRDEVNTHGESQPRKGIIAKFIDGAWIDAVGNDVTDKIKFNLPDHDVFTIDATAPIPKEIKGPFATFDHVGTTLFNMAVNPQTGVIYVANTEANNFTRFEGPGLDPVINTTTRGNIAQSRITIIDNGTVNPIHLNKHIDYQQCCAPPGNAEARKSLAFPRQMVVTKDGKTLYVAALGSAKIGVFDTDALANNSFEPSEENHIRLSGGGPAGLALDENRQRIYALTRFNNAIAVINLADNSELVSVPMHNPEPESVTLGRPFLYDAFLTSSHGDSACASCHIDGDTDHLAWDLGDPTVKSALIPGSTLARTGLAVIDAIGIDTPKRGTTAFTLVFPQCNFRQTVLDPLNVPFPTACSKERIYHFSSNKGPMVTQTLAGMDNHGPMHWRGDRTGGSADLPGLQPNKGMFNERKAFKAFNVAFPGLLGRDQELTTEQMNQFTDFILQNMLPPNPIRNLDNSLTAEQAKGKEIFLGGPTGDRQVDFIRTCNQCHALDLTANKKFGVKRPGFFGTDGRYAFVFSSEILKVPHMRNMYQKVGMFALHNNKDFPVVPGFPFLTSEFIGDQIRGFGFTHDGSLGSLFQFYQAGAFVNDGPDIVSERFPPNSGGFLPYVEPGTWPSNDEELPEGFKYLAKTNTPFFSQLNPATGQPVGLEETRAVEAFSLVFPTNLAPIVGQQVTIQTEYQEVALKHLTLLETQAVTSLPTEHCDLVAKAVDNQTEIGFLYNPENSTYVSSNGDIFYRDEILQNYAPITFTCTPPGDGVRVGLDRDGDNYADSQEVLAGSNPADINDKPLRSKTSWWELFLKRLFKS